MKVTRRQRRQFIRETIMLEGGTDTDVDADVDPEGPQDIPWHSTGTAPWKTNVADTPAKALALAVLKELGPYQMTRFDPEDVIATLNKLGYDITTAPTE